MDLLRTNSNGQLPPGVSHKHVLYSEILFVTSIMRKNSRWASSAHLVYARDSALGCNLGLRISSPSQNVQLSGHRIKEADLMAGFQGLKCAIRDVDGAYHAHRNADTLLTKPPSGRHRASAVTVSPPPILCDHSIAIVNRTHHVCRTFFSA